MRHGFADLQTFADRRQRPLVFDMAERIVVLALYGWLVMRLLPGKAGGIGGYALLLLVSEGVVVVLLLIRRRAQRISLDARDWAVAFAGTLAPLMVTRAGAPLAPGAGLALMLVGLVGHLGAKLSLRRSFGIVPADRGVRTGGFYRLVRHPMYAGYMLAHLGFLLVAPSLWNMAVYAFGWTMLIVRIRAEEAVLAGNPGYRAYMQRVRWRVMPGLF
ncbi:MAG: isoprenylcysteine carboxylmethyltransferase family protein [Alphaproteobacteria bacterium]|nr:MAG: isoprenylcysteine carboxylmethyltransferase family protein [Alphaproteobacteria bacterium]